MTTPGRHPQGRTCGDKRTLLLVLLYLPYAVVMTAVDTLRRRSTR